MDGQIQMGSPGDDILIGSWGTEQSHEYALATDQVQRTADGHVRSVYTYVGVVDRSSESRPPR